MCDTIIMPDGTEIESIVENGTCLCQNTQSEILTWVVQHLPNIEYGEKVKIVKICTGWEVYIENAIDGGE